MHEIDLLEALAGLRPKVVRIRDLTEKVVSAILVTGGRHLGSVATVLVPEEVPTLRLILSDTLSEGHDGVRAHIGQIVIFSEVREQLPVRRILLVSLSQIEPICLQVGWDHVLCIEFDD